MKVTIELPDTAICVFANYVYIDEKGGASMTCKKLDTDDLDAFRKGEKDAV